MGWTLVPLLNFTEIGVPGRLERCIRVLIHLNTDLPQDQIQHVYLEGATTFETRLCRGGNEPAAGRPASPAGKRPKAPNRVRSNPGAAGSRSP